MPMREASRIYLPRALLFGTGITGGVLAAIAVMILFGRAGFDPAGLWRDLLAGQPPQTRTVSGWWALAGTAFVVSAAVTAVLSRLPLPWLRLRLLRWLLGGAIVFGLADVGHQASESLTGHGGAQVAATLAALVIAVLTALFGAYFTVRR
jgi:hypothetical protein